MPGFMASRSSTNLAQKKFIFCITREHIIVKFMNAKEKMKVYLLWDSEGRVWRWELAWCHCVHSNGGWGWFPAKGNIILNTLFCTQPNSQWRVTWKGWREVTRENSRNLPGSHLRSSSCKSHWLNRRKGPTSKGKAWAPVNRELAQWAHLF